MIAAHRARFHPNATLTFTATSAVWTVNQPMTSVDRSPEAIEKPRDPNVVRQSMAKL